MTRRPTLDVVVVSVSGGRIYARKLLASGRRGPRALIGTYEEFGAISVGDILTIPDDIPERDWI